MIIKQNDIIIFEDSNESEIQDIPDNGELVIDLDDVEY